MHLSRIPDNYNKAYLPCQYSHLTGYVLIAVHIAGASVPCAQVFRKILKKLPDRIGPVIAILLTADDQVLSFFLRAILIRTAITAAPAAARTRYRPNLAVSPVIALLL